MAIEKCSQPAFEPGKFRPVGKPQAETAEVTPGAEGNETNQDKLGEQ
jgi:hypothetical protein